MRITIEIDDALYERAFQLAAPGIDKAELIQETLRTFVHVQSAKQLAALGASEPEIVDVRRRRDQPGQ